MSYQEIRNTLEKMINENHADFTKALISLEKDIDNKTDLDKIYTSYMRNDSMNLLSDGFDYLIDELKDQH